MSKSKKKLIILIVVNAILLLLLALVIFRIAALKGMLQSQFAAERFTGLGGERYAQVTAVFPSGAGLSYTEIESFRKSLENKMKVASLEATENGSLWIDGFSMKSSLQVKGFRGSASATAIGVGGDYFFFHPLRLRSGSYISDSDLMKDLVVLNEELAWQLFGGYNVAGKSVTINGIPYIIAGVVTSEKDFASSKANTDGATIYLSYEALASRDNAMFSCYEIVLPNPVSSFAKGIVTERFPNGVADVIENTGRYSIGKIWDLIKGFGERSIQNSGIAYPYWENAARIVEDNLALLFIVFLLLLIFPIICLLILIARIYKKLKSKQKAAFDKLDRTREKLMLQMRSRKSS